MADLPGANVLNILAAAPMNLMNLGARQANELFSTMNTGVQQLAAELAVPPALPQGLPAMPQGLPDLSALIPAAAPTTPAPKDAQAAGFVMANAYGDKPKLITA